jgi:hypothetical protein
VGRGLVFGRGSCSRVRNFVSFCELGTAPTFLTSALDGGEWSASRAGSFILEERAPVPIGYEAGWFPEPIWTLWRR